MTQSVSGRMLIWAAALMLVFFSVTVAALDSVFRELSARAMRDRLDGQLLALIAASDPAPSGTIRPSSPLAEPRFNTPNSGLYGEIRDAAGHTLWRSDSALGAPDMPAARGPVGATSFDIHALPGGREWAQFRLTVDWEADNPAHARQVTFSVNEDTQPYREQLRQFRVRLLSWFGALALLLAAAIAALLRRGLAPLRKLESEILAVEQGKAAELSADYPRELDGVARNLNVLLTSERTRADRYRQTLGNLAHEIKTPLAVLAAHASQLGARERGALEEPIARMDQIVAHQLRRARISAGATLGQPPLDVGGILNELVATMRKVHAARRLTIEISRRSPAGFAGDRGDLLELFGNLLDNACKWARSAVQIEVETIRGERLRPAELRVLIQDDGPGWGQADPQSLFARGARADESAPGYGLGLSIVRELVDAYDGEIRAGTSPLGGARMEVRLPSPA